MRILWICIGGAIGTGARFLLASWLQTRLGSEFPYGTIAVNVTGSMLLGIVMHVGQATDLLSATQRLTLATGVLGGFTTYSTFNYETLRYLEEGSLGRALVNVLTTLALCLAAGLLGVAAARRVVG